MSDVCAVCGLPLAVGDFPCIVQPRPHGPYAVAVIDDTLEGGARVFETMGNEGVYIESKSHWRREVAQRNLEHVDRHDRAHYQRMFRQHDEQLRDEGRTR